VPRDEHRVERGAWNVARDAPHPTPGTTEHRSHHRGDHHRTSEFAICVISSLFLIAFELIS